jgi:hypothetical protein
MAQQVAASPGKPIQDGLRLAEVIFTRLPESIGIVAELFIPVEVFRSSNSFDTSILYGYIKMPE